MIFKIPLESGHTAVMDQTVDLAFWRMDLWKLSEFMKKGELKKLLLFQHRGKCLEFQSLIMLKFKNCVSRPKCSGWNRTSVFWWWKSRERRLKHFLKTLSDFFYSAGWFEDGDFHGSSDVEPEIDANGVVTGFVTHGINEKIWPSDGVPGNVQPCANGCKSWFQILIII